MYSKKRLIYIISIILILSCNSIFGVDEDVNLDDDLGLNTNPNTPTIPEQPSTTDLMTNGNIGQIDMTNTNNVQTMQDNWNLLDNRPDLRNQLYQNNLDQFGTQFSNEQRNNGVDIVDLPQGSQYNPTTNTLTLPGQPPIDMGSLRDHPGPHGRHVIQSTSDGLVVDGNIYHGNTRITANPDGSISTPEGTVTNNDLNIQNGNDITVYPDGTASVTNADQVTINHDAHTSVWGGTGIIITPDNIHIDEAEIIETDQAFLYNITNYNQSTEVFVEDAERVQARDTEFYNVTNATFWINPATITLETEYDTIIKDTSVFIFKPSKNGSIEIDSTIYKLDNATIIIKNETIHTNNSAIVDIGANGLQCLTIEPPGYYSKSYDDPRKDFAINIYNETFHFCINKNVSDTYLPPVQQNWGLIDLYRNLIYLNGQAQYMRYPFRENILSLDYVNVYDGIDKSTKAIFNLDPNGIYIDRLTLNSPSTIIAAVINPSQYLTLHKGSGSLMELSDSSAYNLIKTYQSGITGNNFSAMIENNTYRRANIATYAHDPDLHNSLNAYIGNIGDCLQYSNNKSECRQNISGVFS